MIGRDLWGAPEWAGPAIALAALAAAGMTYSYWRRSAGGAVAALAVALKGVGLGALALALVDPLWTGVRPRKGANIFVLLVDDSQSLQIHDAGADESRGQRLQHALLAESTWQTSLGVDFDVRRLSFAADLRAVDDFSDLAFAGPSTSLAAALRSLQRRFQGLPVAGVLLLSDGNATDGPPDDVPWDALPPIYPVPIGSADDLRDVSVERVAVSEANFESAPVTIAADIRAVGLGRRAVSVALLDEQGQVVETQQVRPDAQSGLAAARFQFRPAAPGVSFYWVAASADGDPAQLAAAAAAGDEATLANNRRLSAVDRGGGPYRILYVSGRPNWEFKFLRRALADDDQLELVGLVRIARREPKFSFRRRGERSTNSLFDGFEHPDDDAAESYDEPVLVRLGTADAEELRGGFPRVADELYRYDALILDDIEADAFTQDQLTLIEEFVSRRGGALLMLGGAESFAAGNYRRSPVANALPVYLDGPSAAATPPPSARLALTREGWLEPWVRLRKTEPEDQQRLAEMPSFQTLNPAGLLKPGATLLAEARDPAGAAHPALAVQRYGRGRAAAILLGDLWRWGLHRRSERDDDLGAWWRQMARWLVTDVPRRVEVDVLADDDGPPGAVTLRARVRDAEYLPLDNAEIAIRISGPEGRDVELTAEPSADEAGLYVARHVARTPGPYRAAVSAVAPDGALVGECRTGWAAQGPADEFQRLAPNRELLEEIAARTGGEVVELDRLDALVASIGRRPAPITEPWTRPIWHHPLYFLATIACLAGEWGLRRWKGLA